MTALVWLRRDLRLHDNPALYQACEALHDGVIAVYTICRDFWQQHHEAQRKIDFWLAHLPLLQKNLAAKNISLVVVEVKKQQWQETFTELFKQYTPSALYLNKELEPNELLRDSKVKEACQKHGVKFHSYDNACILPPGSVVKDDTTPYTVFTPFKKKFLQVLNSQALDIYPVPKKQKVLNIKVPSLDRFAQNKQFVEPSEKSALKQLKLFCEHKIAQYAKERDFPAVDGTSVLSPYLVAGTLSPRVCLQMAEGVRKSKGQETWINELIWRDFYKHILYFFPRVAKNKAFKLETDKIKWNNKCSHFEAWSQGKTGVPIVDAAMRQLVKTGWMHNRCRMIVAMFLSKNLFLNWREGEQFFMQHLIDGDLAANNGGWQWSASTGTDAAPYFRIFNPYRQSERFDPSGDYIRTYVPELASLDDKQIHQPPKMDNYPEPIVDVSQTRADAIAAFKDLKSV